MMKEETRVLRFTALQKKVPASRATIFRWERDGKFPKHIQLGANSVGWVESQVDEWITARIEGCKNDNT